MDQEAHYLHPKQGVIRREIERPRINTIKKLAGIPTAVFSDCLGKLGVMHSSIKPLATGMVICGPAITCLGPDYLIRKMAMDLSIEGDVLLIANEGNTERSCFGERTSKKLMAKKLAGVVIDGATRDASDIRKLGFPVFVKSITPRNYHYPHEPGRGGVNVDIVCGGIIIHPGDLIIGDDDGVIVIPKKQADLKVSEIIHYFKRDQEKSSSVGEYKPFKVEKELKSTGYRFC